MAGISAIQRLLDNQLTSKFARSLKHSDLPEGWADNPEIVALAEDAYREAGTESPFFKAWSDGNVLSNENGTPERVFRGLGENYKEETSNLPLSWVTPDRELANAYAYHSAKSLKNPSGGEVLSLYAKTASPFSFGFSGVADTTPQEMRGRIVKAISDSFVAGNISAAQGKKAIAKLKPLLTSDDGLVKNWEVWDNYPEIKEALSDIGHDALFALENGKPTYGVFNPAQLKSFFNRGTFNPADPNIYKGLIPAVGAGGLLSLIGAEEAEAAPYQFPADKRGTVRYEAGLESPSVDPVDVLLAPIGAVGAGAKAAAMAAEPFVSYGMDKALDYISKLWGEE